MPDDAFRRDSARACVVRRMQDADTARWDAFVAALPQATFFHRAAWCGLIEGLGHRGHYLLAERDGAITGILPLAEIRSRLFGHALISTPFCVYGGTVAADAASATALDEAAVALAATLRVDYLEMRDRGPVHPGWPVKDLYVSFSKPLDADHDDNFKTIPGKQRNMVRKGIKLGLVAEHGAPLADFYQVYAESVRNLGTPVLPRRWYADVHEAFGDDFEITVIRHQGRPVATNMSFYFRDQVHPYYAGGTWSARALAANDFMYWALMQRAVERGARMFDFGRSKRGTGSYDFKQHWGFQAQPLPYAYHLVRATEVPNISPTNRKYQLFIKAWQRLPLKLSCALGPWLARDLG